jgi:hypothetical protein
MAVNTEIWKPEVVNSLFASNEFMGRSVDATREVVNNAIVHIPQAPPATETLINNNDFPVIAVQVADDDITYALDRFYKKPVHIRDFQKKELSFDERQSVIKEYLGSLMVDVGTWLLYRWFNNVPNAATHRVPTSGAVGAASLKLLTEADILSAQATMNKQDVPKEGRVLLLDSDHETQLRSDGQLKYAFQQVVDLKNGSIGRLHGFDIYSRSTVGRLSNAGVLKLPNAASATTDKPVSCFWQEDCVERAIGSVEIFDNPNRAEYYGDLISFLVRNGGRHRRKDLKGFGLIVPSA